MSIDGGSAKDYKADFFNRYASTHTVHRKGVATVDRFRHKSRTWERTLGHFLPKSRDKILVDIGCGDGKLLWWLQSIGFKSAEGIDISEEQIRIAEAIGIANVSVCDIHTYLGNRKDALDMIFLRDVLEHFCKEDIMDILSACRTALRPGGRILLQVPNAESPFFGRIRYGDFTHELAFCSASLGQIFHNSGFIDDEYHPAGPVLNGLRSVPRLLLWKCAEALYKLLLYAETGSGKKIVTQNVIAVATRGN